MKNKKVSFTLPEEDIRSVATILASRSIGRFTNEFGTCNQKLQESLATGDNKEILTSINRLINHMHDSVKELKQEINELRGN